MPPNFDPMVATGRPSAAVAMVAAATAIRSPGQCGRRCFRPTMMAMVANASPMVAGSAVGTAAQRAGSLSSSGPGSAPARVSPNSSRIWLAKMMMAMPAVKPTVTG